MKKKIISVILLWIVILFPGYPISAAEESTIEENNFNSVALQYVEGNDENGPFSQVASWSSIFNRSYPKWSAVSIVDDGYVGNCMHIKNLANDDAVGYTALNSGPIPNNVEGETAVYYLYKFRIVDDVATTAVYNITGGGKTLACVVNGRIACYGDGSGSSFNYTLNEWYDIRIMLLASSASIYIKDSNGVQLFKNIVYGSSIHNGAAIERPKHVAGSEFAIDEIKRCSSYKGGTVENDSIKIGDYLSLGRYYGAPILWRCVDIDENGPLILSDKALCFKAFDAANPHDENLMRAESGSNSWKDSSLRAWLNSEKHCVSYPTGSIPEAERVCGIDAYDDEPGFLFLHNFAPEEKQLIKEVKQRSICSVYDKERIVSDTEEVSRSKGFSVHKRTCDVSDVVQNAKYALSCDVTDRVFLLDVTQLNRVYQNRNILGEQYFQAKITDEALAHTNSDAWVHDGYVHSWLRTPYALTSSYVRCAYRGNQIYEFGANWSGCAVRPAFYLNSDVIIITNGDGTKESPFSYTTGSLPLKLLGGNYGYYGDYTQMADDFERYNLSTGLTPSQQMYDDSNEIWTSGVSAISERWNGIFVNQGFKGGQCLQLTCTGNTNGYLKPKAISACTGTTTYLSVKLRVVEDLRSQTPGALDVAMLYVNDVKALMIKDGKICIEENKRDSRKCFDYILNQWYTILIQLKRINETQAKVSYVVWDEHENIQLSLTENIMLSATSSSYIDMNQNSTYMMLHAGPAEYGTCLQVDDFAQFNQESFAAEATIDSPIMQQILPNGKLKHLIYNTLPEIRIQFNQPVSTDSVIKMRDENEEIPVSIRYFDDCCIIVSPSERLLHGVSYTLDASGVIGSNGQTYEKGDKTTCLKFELASPLYMKGSFNYGAADFRRLGQMTIPITFNSHAKYINATVLAALFEAETGILSWIGSKQIVQGEKTQDVTFDGVPQNAEDMTLRVFVWESLKTINPIFAVE